MKKIIYFLFFSINYLFAQGIEDLGKKTYNEILIMEQPLIPCDKIANELLIYCVEGSSNKISYLFKNSILNAVQLHTVFENEIDANYALKITVNNFQKKNEIKPIYKDGIVYFYSSNVPIFVTLKIMYYDNEFFLAEHFALK